MEPKKYPYIDCLRGIAILLVVMIHAGNYWSTPFFNETALKFIQNGKYGVMLFFVVSSYTLMLSLNSRQNEEQWVKKFFIRRFFRIAPLYWIALIYFTLSKVVGMHFFLNGISANPIDWGKFLSNLFFVHGLSPQWINSYVPGGWSIGDETIFYLILPLLFIKIKNINTCIVFLFISIFAGMILEHFLVGTRADQSDYLFLYFPAQLPVFLLGILSFFVVKEGFSKINNTSMVLICCGIFLSLYFTPPYHFLYSFVFFMMIIILNQKNYRLFVNPVLAYIGKISYSIYITHFAIIQVCKYLNIFNLFEETSVYSSLFNFLFRFFSILTLSVIVSAFSYTFIEKRFELIGKNLIKKIPGQEK